MSSAYSEDQLVEQPAIQLFAEMGWKTVSAIEWKRQWSRVLYSHIGTTAEQMRLGCMASRETITAS